MPRVTISSGPSSEKDIGNDIALPLLSPATVVTLPPWVQDGNDADPDERSGSFTENRQNRKR